MIAQNNDFVNDPPDSSGNSVSELLTWINETLDDEESSLAYPSPLTLNDGTIIDPRDMRKSALAMRSITSKKRSRVSASDILIKQAHKKITHLYGAVTDDVTDVVTIDDLVDTPSEASAEAENDVWLDLEIDSSSRIIISVSEGIIMLKEVETKDGAGLKRIVISDFPLMPIEILSSTGNITGADETYIKVRFLSVIGVIREITLSLDALMSPHSAEFKRECIRAGYPLPDHQAKNFAEAMTRLIKTSGHNKTSGLVTIKKGRGACGWHDGEHYTPGSAGYAGPIPDMAIRRGNPEIWKSIMREVFNHSPALSIAISSAFGGYLRGLVPDVKTNNILHFWSPNGNRGKTTLLEILCSIQGEPSRSGKAPIADATSTAVGLERFLSACNNGFFCIDEVIGLFSQRDPIKILMDITNGGGRAKAGADEGLKRGLTYMLQVFSSGNKSILDAGLSSMQGGREQEQTLNTRIMEINIDEGSDPLFIGAATDINDFTKHVMGGLVENHGHGYELAIKYIQENTDHLVMVHGALTNKMIPHMPANADTRRAKDLSFIAVGMMIAKNVLNLPQEDYERGFANFESFVARYHSRGESKVEVQQNQFENLKSFVYANIGRFCVTGHLHPDFIEDKSSTSTNTDNARIHTQKVLSRGVSPLGLIEQKHPMSDMHDFTGVVYINRKNYELEAKKLGIKLEEIARIARDNKWLILTSSDIKQQRMTTRKTGFDACYAFDFEQYLFNTKQEPDPYDLLTAEDFPAEDFTAEPD